MMAAVTGPGIVLRWPMMLCQITIENERRAFWTKARRGCMLALVFVMSGFSLQSWAADVPQQVQDQVASRVGDGQLAPPIVNTSRVMAGSWVYFVSRKVPYGQQSGDAIDAYLLFADNSGKWHDVWFDRYDEDGGTPEIASVFFANLGGKKKPDMALSVLVRTPQEHLDYSGAFYDGYVYRLTGTVFNGAVFVGLQQDISKPFIGQCDCEFGDDRKTQKAPYTTAASMRRAIEQRYMASR